MIAKSINKESHCNFMYLKRYIIKLCTKYIWNFNIIDRNEGPQLTSPFNYIKMGFKEGSTRDAYDLITDAVNKKKWTIETAPKKVEPKLRNIELRTGIGGIEKLLVKKQNANEENMQLAFQDLSVLITKAKDMVNLANQISNKIKEKTGDISEDETVRFKSYLLSLGIETPVTRDAYKSDTLYFENLAKQVVEIVEKPVGDAGGMMTLFDVYCRVNRARGMEVISPLELLNACKMMHGLGLPLKLHQFDSGVIVLQVTTMLSEENAVQIAELIEERGSLTPEDLAQMLGISILLAKERLFWAEQHGKTCRDDSIEGLRFYPNLFLLKD